MLNEPKSKGNCVLWHIIFPPELMLKASFIIILSIPLQNLIRGLLVSLEYINTDSVIKFYQMT